MRHALRIFLPILLLVVAFLLLGRPADSASPPVGIDKRIPWTTSRLTGSPEAPPPYQTERVFLKLKFHFPVTITRAPGSERLFVVELLGKIYSFPEEQDCETPDLFLDVGKVAGHYRTYGLV